MDGRKRDITNEWKRVGHAGGNGAGKEERDEAGGGRREASLPKKKPELNRTF